MPKGPRGEKRLADVIGNAVKVMKIATGEEPEDYGSKPEKNPGRCRARLSGCRSSGPIDRLHRPR
jgi:hypothetical protein